jgi:hypothetical protein
MNIPDIIRSQYHATLAMLKQTITRCPDELWNGAQDRNKFWHVAYHAMFYTHLYLSVREVEFKPWVNHRADAQFMGPKPWPPHDLPEIGEPYTREDLNAYIDYCWQFVDSQVPALDMESSSGFDWLPMNKLELQIYNIRHLQQHTGELMERLGNRAGIDVDWRGSIP